MAGEPEEPSAREVQRALDGGAEVPAAETAGGLLARAAWRWSVRALEQGEAGAFLQQSQRAVAGLARAGEHEARRVLALRRTELLYDVAAELMVRRHGLPGFLEVCKHDGAVLVELAAAGDDADPRWEALSRWRQQVLPALVTLLDREHGGAPLAVLARRLGLDPLETTLAMVGSTLAMAPSLIPREARAEIPTGELAVEAEWLATVCFADPETRQRGLDRLLAGGRLHRWAVVEMPRSAPPAVFVEPGLCAFLRGRWSAPPRAGAAVLLRQPARSTTLGPGQQQMAVAAGQAIARAAGAVILLTGPAGAGKSTVARAVAAALGQPLLCVELSRLPAEERIAAICARDALLGDAVVLLRVGDDGALPPAWLDLVEGGAVPVICEVDLAAAPALAAGLRPRRPDVLVVELAALALGEQVAIWRSALAARGLEAGADEALEERVCRPRLVIGDVAAVAASLAAAGKTGAVSAAELAAALDAALARELAQVAEILAPAEEPAAEPASADSGAAVADRGAADPPIAAELAALVRAGADEVAPGGLTVRRSRRPRPVAARLRGDERAAAAVARALARRLSVPACRVDLARVAAQPPADAARHLARLLVAVARASAVLCLARADCLADPAAVELANRLGTLLGDCGGCVLVATAGDAPLPATIEAHLARDVALAGPAQPDD